MHSPQPRVSAEVFVIPLETGKCLVYAPLRRAAFVANAALVNFLADIQNGHWQRRADPDGSVADFLRSLEILDAPPEQQPDDGCSGAPQPTELTLFLTTACNLRCSYCYASAGDRPVETMEFWVARQGIDFVAKNAIAKRAPGFAVGFHGGGEPTVHWKMLTDCWAYARQKADSHGLNLTCYLATNGVMPETKLRWIAEHLDGISLSYDGLPHIHDSNRCTIKGQGSSRRVLQTMKQLDELGASYSLRMTVTQQHIHSIPESVEFVLSRFEPGRIMIEPIYKMGRGRDNPSAETQLFVDKFIEARRIARPYRREIVFSGARAGLISSHFCGVSQDGFSLSANGKVSGCYEVFSETQALADTFFYGEALDDGGFGFDMEKLNHLRQQRVVNREFCRGCFAKWSCGGDCYHKILNDRPGALFEGSDRCHIIRELTKEQILDKISQFGGRVWHELPASC